MTINVAPGLAGGGVLSGGLTYQGIRNTGAGAGAWGGRPYIDASLSPYSVDASGTADSAAAINSAIAALPSGGGTISLPYGTFKCNSPIALKSGVELVGIAPPWCELVRTYTPVRRRIDSEPCHDDRNVQQPVGWWWLTKPGY